jgi:hypothetical protein
MRGAGADAPDQRRQGTAGRLFPPADAHLRHDCSLAQVGATRCPAVGPQAAGCPDRAHRDHELLLLPQRLRPHPRPAQRARPGERGGYRLVRDRARAFRVGRVRLGLDGARGGGGGRRRSQGSACPSGLGPASGQHRCRQPDQVAGPAERCPVRRAPRQGGRGGSHHHRVAPFPFPPLPPAAPPRLPTPAPVCALAFPG